MPILEVTGLAKRFGGVLAVDSMSFTVEPGEIRALIGPNGAGKSTCFNMLMGQLRPDTGQVRLDGEDITGRRPREIWRKGVGRTFQIAQTLGSMTVRENVQMALISHHRELGVLWRRALDRHADEAMGLLERVGMAAQWDRHAGVLAYGDVKRMELAIGLANNPRLLLMDEPTSGMAPAERVELMALAADIARRDGVGVLFTEHDMDVVFQHADRIMVMDRGRLLAEGTPAEVRDDPEVRRVYLGGTVASEGVA